MGAHVFLNLETTVAFLFVISVSGLEVFFELIVHFSDDNLLGKLLDKILSPLL